MFARKKIGAKVCLDPAFGGVNTARTFNVRRKECWVPRILFDTNNEDVPRDHDESDKQQQAFFGCDLPEPNDSFLLCYGEVSAPDRPLETVNVIDVVSMPDIASLIPKKKNVPVVHMKQECPDMDGDIKAMSEEEDDDIQFVGEVINKPKMPLTVLQIRTQSNMLSAFMKEKGVKEMSPLERKTERKKGHDPDCLRKELLDDLEKLYLSVSCQRDRKKKKFLRRQQETHDLHLVDTPVRGKKGKKKTNNKKKKGKNQSTKVSVSKRTRSPSPIHIELSSDDDVPRVSKKTAQNKKKLSPSAAPKRPAYGKFARKPEDEGPKVAPAAYDVFVPKKANKLRSATVDDYLKVAQANKERNARPKEKDDGLKLMAMKRKSDQSSPDRPLIDPRKVKTPGKERPMPSTPWKGMPVDGTLAKERPVSAAPRKERPLPPTPWKGMSVDGTPAKGRPVSDTPRKERHIPPTPGKGKGKPVAHTPQKSSDMNEPVKKKPRVDAPSEPSDDILGKITGAMTAQAAEAQPKVASSPDISPRKMREEWVLPREPIMASLAPPRFEMHGADDDMDISNSSPDVTPRPPEEKTISPAFSDEGIEVERRASRRDDGGLSMDGLVADGQLAQDPLNQGNFRDDEGIFNVDRQGPLDQGVSRAQYRFTTVTNAQLPPASISPSNGPSEATKIIPMDPMDKALTDPRIFMPSPGTLSEWKNSRVPISLDSVDAPIEVIKKVCPSEEEESWKKKKKKKGVQWGETATKEFDPDDENEIIDVEKVDEEKKINESEQVTGIKEVGGKQYKIVKKVRVPSPPPAPKVTVSLPPPTKSCLKPPSFQPLDLHMDFRPQMTPPRDKTRDKTPEYEDDDDHPFHPMNFITPTKQAPAIRISPPTNFNGGLPLNRKWTDIVPQSVDDKKKKEEEERREKEKREEEERRRRNANHSSDSSPEVIEVASTSKRNGGASSSTSMTNITEWREYEKGSEIIGDRAPLPLYKMDEVKDQLEMRAKIADELKVHRTMSDDPDMEYPEDEKYLTNVEQLREQDMYHNELTYREMSWKADGMQRVWLQSLPYQTHFSFDRDAGLYWPVVQATDGISENDSDFESRDVLRSLGNNTHFATEKKALLGMETRLPNGMTHKERFEAFFKGGPEKPEPRFTNRRMYSRVFSHQSVEEARVIQTERMEEDRRLLREHEEVMRKNAPEGVSVERCRLNIDRPAGFKNFFCMIQHYKRDKYESDQPFQNPDWYCNKSDYYMPYTDRANYLCRVINWLNYEYNQLYDVDEHQEEITITLDKAAFAAAQISLGQMEGWQRVGMEKEEYEQLLKRNKERRALIEAPWFSLEKYTELSALDELEQPHFHLIIDWLSSTFKTIKPISEWRLGVALDSAFKEILLTSDKMDRQGQPRDAREVFYESFKAGIPQQPTAKRSRYDD